MAKVSLEVGNRTKRFWNSGDDDPTVLQYIKYAAEKGAFACIFGHSGCRKLAILNALAGSGESGFRLCRYKRKGNCRPAH